MARSAAKADPSRVHSIVTVATPVRGARIALDPNIGLAKFVVSDAIVRIRDVILMLPFASTFLQDPLSSLSTYRSYIDGYHLPLTDAWRDVRPGSDALANINSAPGPHVPVAQVVGNIPPAKAHYRLLASTGLVPYTMEQLVHRERMGLFYCRILTSVYGFTFILGGHMGMRCFLAAVALDRIDVAFLQAVTGKTPAQQFFFPVPYDGIVGGTDVQWIGWGDHRGVLTAQGQDHIAVQRSSIGIERQRQAMLLTQVVPK